VDDGARPAEPVVEPAVGVAEVVGDTADTDVPVPSVTMPLLVPAPGVAAVCANAGRAAAIETTTA